MKRLLVAMAFMATLAWLPACKSGPKDEEIKTEVDAVLASEPTFAGLTADVKDGVVTVNGMVPDPSVKTSLNSHVVGVKGVKSVTDNTTVAPPPPPAPAEPVISENDPLAKGVADALKDHPGIKATVTDGVITVTGEAKAAEWKTVKMALDGLRPKKVDRSGLKVK